MKDTGDDRCSGCTQRLQALGLGSPLGLAGNANPKPVGVFFDLWERGPHGRMERLKSGKSIFFRKKSTAILAGMRPLSGNAKRDKFQIDCLLEKCPI